MKNLPIELENTTQGHLFHVIIYHTFGTLEISKLPACHFRPLNTHCYSICLTPLVFFLFANAKKDGTHHANGYEFSFQPIRANFSTNFRRGKYPSTSIVIQSTYLFSLPRTALRMAPPSSLFSLYLSPSPSSRNVQIQGGSFKWNCRAVDKDSKKTKTNSLLCIRCVSIIRGNCLEIIRLIRRYGVNWLNEC